MIAMTDFVVLYGTDQMAYSASMLSHMLQGLITCDFHRPRTSHFSGCELMLGEFDDALKLRQLKSMAYLCTRSMYFHSSYAF